MMRGLKRLLALLSATVLLAGMMVMTTGSALANGTVYYDGQGVTDGELNSVICDANSTPYLHWIFTLGGGDNTVTSATLTVSSPGFPDEVVVGVKNGNNFSFYSGFYDLDTISASVAYVGTLGSGTSGLRISHGCPGLQAAIANITTELHAGINDVGGKTVIADGSNIPLGSTIHDSSTIETAPVGVELPAGSSVTFYFFTSLDCGEFDTALAVDSNETSISGLDRSVDPGIVEGPLAAGDYSFFAFFHSSDTDVVTNATSDCEPFTVDKAQLGISTTIHNANHNPIANNSTIALGSVVHDTAQITGAVSGFAIGAVTFTIFPNLTCTAGTGTTIATNGTNEGNGDPRSVATGVLVAGDYAFQASVAGNGNYLGATSACEPFTVGKGDTRTSTQVHDAAHNDITNRTVVAGSFVHDKAIVTGLVTGITITGNVTFKFFTNGTCAGDPVGTPEAVAIGADGTAESTAMQINAAGSYSYLVSYGGDANYNNSTGVCEPFAVVPRAFGKTMGFWGNKNGQTVLRNQNAFTSANAVELGGAGGCYIKVDSAAKSLTILPLTLNGITLTTCGGPNGLDAGINTNSFNVLLAQTLALSYNIKYVTNYAGQTIANLGCTPVGTLTSGSTVQNVRDYANVLIRDAKNGAPVVTQTQIGQLNTLLGCLNRES